jgi:antitoxin ParD1/3/4
MEREQMNISLTPELEHFVQNKVNSGMYTSASEVIRESLRLLHTHDDLQNQRIQQLNQAIDIGLQQLNAGKKIPAHEIHNRMQQKINTLTKNTK